LLPLSARALARGAVPLSETGGRRSRLPSSWELHGQQAGLTKAAACCRTPKLRAGNILRAVAIRGDLDFGTLFGYFHLAGY